MKNILFAFLGFITVSSALPAAFGQSELRMKVEVAANANDDNPIEVDLVLVTDETLLDALKGISASEWFENRQQYLLDYPDETGLRAGSWEWVPGQSVGVVRITVKPEIVGGIIFANYSASGPHRAVINPRKSFSVTLDEKDITVH